MLWIGRGVLTWLLGVNLALSIPVAAIAQDAAEHVMRGVVLGPDDQPLANAEVWLVTSGMSVSSADVLAAVRSDANGRYAVTVPSRWSGMHVTYRQELGLVARSSDGGLTAVSFYRSTTIPADGVRLKVPAAAKTTIRVLSPDGDPIAGAKVAVDSTGGPQLLTEITPEQEGSYPGSVRTPLGLAIKHTTIPLPGELQRRFSGVTADDGTLTLEELAPEQVGQVRIESPKFGTQLIFYAPDQLPFRAQGNWPAEIRLSATGRVRGRLISDKPEWSQNRRLRVFSRPETTPPGAVTRTIGWAEPTTDAAGRFEIAGLAEGRVIMSGARDEASPMAIQFFSPQVLAAGQTQDFEIPVLPTVRVRGFVKDVDGSTPIAGLDLVVISGYAVTTARSDGQGMYQIDLPVGQALVAALLPRSLFPASDADRGATPFDVPKDQAQFQAPPINLRRAANISGVVVDAAGKPVAGATVAGSWFGYAQRSSAASAQEVVVLTNDRGEFTIGGVDLRSELRLRARTADASTADTTALRRPPTEPISLRISTDNMARIHGRVVDSAGRPVADLPLELWSRGRLPGPFRAGNKQAPDETPGLPHRIDFPAAQTLRTDARGAFTTAPLEPGLEYRVELRERGFREAMGDWVLLKKGGIAVLADLTARREGEVRGLARDRKGRPVAGAFVTWSEAKNRIETTTDDKGTFHFADVADGGAFVFARKEGFRFFGRRQAGDAAAELEVVLESPSESPETAFLIVPREGRPDDRRARAVKYVQEQLASAPDDSARMRALNCLAGIDPAGALARLDERPFKEPLMKEMVRRKAIQTLAPRDIDAALEIVETVSDGLARSMVLCEVCDLLPASERQRKLELLAEAILHVRSIKEPEMRLGGTGFVAERLLDLGERERGEKLLRDELETARKLGTAEFAGFTRGAFAEELGQVDLPAALELIKDLKDAYEYDRHHGNLAHELAGKQPAEAERVLNLLKPPQQNQFSQRDHFAVRVCYRMATVDLPRAERLTLSIGDLCQRGYALGVIAAALPAKDQSHARELLRRAYDVLEEAERNQKPGKGPHHPATIAGALLSFAAKLDSDAKRQPLLQECVWRTVALVPPSTNDPNKSYYVAEAVTTVALWLADYDTLLAREVLSRFDPQAAASSRTYVSAVAVVADEQLENILEGLANENSRTTVRLDAAGILTLSGDELRRRIHHLAGLWPIDVEDVFW